jgi:hypothetical protein
VLCNWTKQIERHGQVKDFEKRWKDVGKVKRKGKKTQKKTFTLSRHRQVGTICGKQLQDCSGFHQWPIHFSTER